MLFFIILDVKIGLLIVFKVIFLLEIGENIVLFIIFGCIWLDFNMFLGIVNILVVIKVIVIVNNEMIV